jgi:3-oxoadipate CoA-transferase alpha subunit
LADDFGNQSTISRKVYPSAADALAGLTDGAVVVIGGYAGRGVPETLVRALMGAGAKSLTCVCQGAWPRQAEFPDRPDRPDRVDVADLVEAGLLKKLVAPLPFHPEHGGPVKDSWEAGNLEIEAVPTGTLAERLRAGGAGIGGVFLPTGAGTRFADGREVREIDGRDHFFQPALKADFALLRAHEADTLGNLVYRGTQRNWNPIMAMCASITVAEVDQVHEPGGIDPELVITPAIFVDRIVQTR